MIRWVFRCVSLLDHRAYMCLHVWRCLKTLSFDSVRFFVTLVTSKTLLSQFRDDVLPTDDSITNDFLASRASLILLRHAARAPPPPLSVRARRHKQKKSTKRLSDSIRLDASFCARCCYHRSLSLVRTTESWLGESCSSMNWFPNFCNHRCVSDLCACVCFAVVESRFLSYY